MDTFDYVIVGAGSAGSVLANRLSEDAGTTICVLEAGPSDWHPYIHLPAGFIKTFHMKSINWAYQQEPGPWTGGRSIYAPRGKTLGGSSSINGHIYNRGQRQDFDTWAQFGNRGWGYQDVLPYFKRLERRVGEGDDAFRGRDGNLTVTTMDWRDPLCEAFMAGAISLGIPRNPDYNGAIQEGVSYAQRTIKNGLRVSAATAFLHPARKRPNVQVRTHAHATDILFEGKRAVGVRYARGGRGGAPVEIRAAKEVILAGGTYNSPQLLQLSGIGSPDLLASLGIEVRHALAGVGEGLQDHYAPRSVARVKNIKTINERRKGLGLMWGGDQMGDHAARPALAVADHGLLLLAFRRVDRKLRLATDLYARELQGGRAGRTRGSARYDGGVLAATARKPWLCSRAVSRSFRCADHSDQLPRRRARPPHRGRRHEAGAPPAGLGAARAVL
jgi:choline dehydrogenase